MSVESCQCPNCGGALLVNAFQDTATCRYCGGTVIIKDNRQQNTVDGIPTFNALMLAAQEAIEYDEDFDKASQKYKQALDLKPGDYRALWGLFLCEIDAIEWAYNRKGFVQVPDDVEDCIENAIRRYGNRAYQNAPAETQTYYAQEFEKIKERFEM